MLILSGLVWWGVGEERSIGGTSFFMVLRCRGVHEYRDSVACYRPVRLFPSSKSKESNAS